MPRLSRRAWFAAVPAAALGVGALVMQRPRGTPVVVPGAERLRGVTVSCQTWGWEWGDPAMARTMDELGALGANAIAFHPYASIQPDGGVHWRYEDRPPWIVRPLAWAKERGMSAMVIPHLAYWGSPFKWRGDIRFSDPAAWSRFFAEYERWIVGLASVAEEGGAPLFCVGLEYTHAQKFEAEWRRIIAAVRAVYRGRITYGANWNEIDAVPFWDALDHVGVLAYFPLTIGPDPTPRMLDKAWERRAQELSAISARTGKSILFVELGYDVRDDAAARPWADDGEVGPGARAVQVRCLEAGLRFCESAPWLAGVFLWKWFPDLRDHERETFDLRAPETREAIRTAWGRGL